MNDQVKTADGYNFGGTSYKNEERTDSQGQKYSVAIPISSVTTATQPQFQTPAPTTPIDYNSITTDIATPYDAAVQVQQQNQLNAPADITSLMNTIAGKSAFESQQNESTGLNAANQEAIKKAAEISALGKQAAAAQQENISQGRQLGSVSSFVAGQGAEIERNRAIKSLSLGAELDAIQGNIEIAKSKVKQAVDAQYADKELALANKLKMFDLNQSILGNLTSQQQKAFEQAKYKVEQEQKRLDKEKETKLDTENLIIEAIPNAPANVIAKAKQLFQKGASKMEVAQALGVYGGDYLKNELLKEQFKTEKAQQSKIYTDIAKTKAETTGLSTTGIPSKPLTEGQSKDLTYAQRTDQASPKIESLGTSILSMNPISFSTQMKLAESSLTSGQVSPEIRQYNQAVRNFITANLRRESGATINPSEFKDAYQIYIPFPGDDATTLQSKKQARETAIASFKSNVPGYDARVATPEKSYVDTALSAVNKVEEKTSPINSYTSRLIGLPGVKP